MMHNLLRQATSTSVNIQKLESLFLNSLEYIFEAYMLFSKNMPFSYAKEDDINDEFCKYLDEVVEGKGITFQPQFFNPGTRARTGIASKVDFKILWSTDTKYKNYQFYVECKLLKCNGKNQAYIDSGINRFKTNFYSKDLPFAAMVGYIERGEHNSIVTDISSRMPGEELNQFKKNNGHIVWRSEHLRSGNSDPINLYHILLDFRDSYNSQVKLPCRGDNELKSNL